MDGQTRGVDWRTGAESAVEPKPRLQRAQSAERRCETRTARKCPRARKRTLKGSAGEDVATKAAPISEDKSSAEVDVVSVWRTTDRLAEGDVECWMRPEGSTDPQMDGAMPLSSSVEPRAGRQTPSSTEYSSEEASLTKENDVSDSESESTEETGEDRDGAGSVSACPTATTLSMLMRSELLTQIIFSTF